MIKYLIGFAAGLMMTQASATVYSFETTNPDGSAFAGDITQFETTFDDSNNQFSMSLDIAHNGNYETANAGWFVINNGYLPDIWTNPVAMAYMNFDTGDLFVYEYNYTHYSSAWETGELIHTYTDAINVANTADGISVNMDLDVSIINDHDHANANWQGIRFDEEMGIWAFFTHATTFETTDLADPSQNYITNFDSVNGLESKFDEDRIQTEYTSVSEPVGLSLLGLLLLPLMRRRFA